ncbi:MAG: [Fe-Fe] hydrogenase large subunit C-terminal domain-containing protein, partial [Oscillospiraceae bacterium]
MRLDEEKCRGCINCIKRCPTGAIRVRQGKAYIISERCIDCGECIKICPHHAKYAEKYSFNEILNFKYRIALPAPTLYGQFNNLDDTDYVLTAFKMLGFDDVFEVSKGAELISEATRIAMAEGNLLKPVISSACPAVVRLIRVRFPNLIPNVLPINAPMEESARLARIKAVKETGLAPEDIGVFFIS